MGVVVVCGGDGGSMGMMLVGIIPIGRGQAVVVWAAIVLQRGAAVHVGCIVVITVHQEGGSRVRGVIVGGIIFKCELGTMILIEEGEIEVFAANKAQLRVSGVGRMV